MAPSVAPGARSNGTIHILGNCDQSKLQTLERKSIGLVQWETCTVFPPEQNRL